MGSALALGGGDLPGLVCLRARGLGVVRMAEQKHLLSAGAEAQRELTDTASGLRRWPKVVMPWLCTTWWATAALPQAGCVAFQTKRVRRFGSKNRSAVGPDTGSLAHALSWFMRLLWGQV